MRNKRTGYILLTFVFMFFLLLNSKLTFANVDKYENVQDYDNLGEEDVKKFFYNQLSQFEKDIYSKIESEDIKDLNITILKSDVMDMTNKEIEYSVKRAIGALVSDNPRYRLYYSRYFDSFTEDNNGNYIITWNKNYYASEYRLNKVEARINQIVNTVKQDGDDRYTTLRKLWEYLGEETEYQTNSVFGSARMLEFDDSAYGIMLADAAVCAGYADSIKILCDEMDIPCIVVGNGAHAWNFIQMEDGKWYSYDGTSTKGGAESYILMGSTSLGYQYESNYWETDLYILQEGDFVFPILSDEQYVYSGGNTDFSVEEAELVFDELEPTFIYSVNDDGKTCTITDYIGLQEGDLVIPEELDGYAVTRIGEDAFFACKGFEGSLQFPETVSEIGKSAFLDCKFLSGKLSLPPKVEIIGGNAFLGCEGFTGNLVLPDTLKEIHDYAFARCFGLTGDIIIPDDIEILGGAFSYCRGLNGDIYLPDNIEWNSNLIMFCNFQNIIVSENNEKYTSIDGILYSKDKTVLLACPQAKTGEVYFYEGLKRIEAHAFESCGELTGDLILPEGVESVGEFAFSGAGFNGILVLPSTLTKVECCAFQGVDVTGDLILPEALLDIGESAFCTLMNMKGKLVLPSKLTYIPRNAFDFSGFTGSIEIPPSVVSIGDYAFSICYGLESINLSNVQSLGYHAFEEGRFPVSFNCNNEYLLNLAAERGWEYSLNHEYDNGHCIYCGRSQYIASWISEGNRWKYQNSDGTYSMNCWQKIDVKWYRFDEDGYMQIGWNKLGGRWYYLDKSSGAMKTGWVKDSGKWYYLDKSSGAMKTGWVKDSGKWYYLDKSSGAMKTGWVKDSGKWYYLDKSSGAMKTGWIQDGGKWYYLESSGAMAANKWVGNYYLQADGSMAVSKWIGRYYVGADGVWCKTR